MFGIHDPRQIRNSIRTSHDVAVVSSVKPVPVGGWAMAEKVDTLGKVKLPRPINGFNRPRKIVNVPLRD